MFANFMTDFCKEFFPSGWDDELHAHICNSQLHSTDVILRGTAYHFSDDTLHLQLDTLLNADLCIHCKNCKIKELVELAVNNAGEKTPEACLSCWVLELHKLTEECAHNMTWYFEARV